MDQTKPIIRINISYFSILLIVALSMLVNVKLDNKHIGFMSFMSMYPSYIGIILLSCAGLAMNSVYYTKEKERDQTLLEANAGVSIALSGVVLLFTMYVSKFYELNNIDDYIAVGLIIYSVSVIAVNLGILTD